jgi:hypothetical protein
VFVGGIIWFLIGLLTFFMGSSILSVPLSCLAGFLLVRGVLGVCRSVFFCKHPLAICSVLVGRYILCAAIVGIVCSVVRGCVLFLMI